MLELLQKNLRLLFFCPAERLGDWVALRYSGSAPLSRLVDPRSGHHDIQQLATFYLTENPLQLPNSAILFASSRYLLITRIPGYFRDIKLKSVAVGKIPQNVEVWKIHEQRFFEVGGGRGIVLWFGQIKLQSGNKAYWKSLVLLKRIVFWVLATVFLP